MEASTFFQTRAVVLAKEDRIKTVKLKLLSQDGVFFAWGFKKTLSTSSLEPLVISEWTFENTAYGTKIVEALPIHSWIGLRQSAERIYILQLIQKLLCDYLWSGKPLPDLYKILILHLNLLEQSSDDLIWTILACFAVKFLKHEGLWESHLADGLDEVMSKKIQEFAQVSYLNQIQDIECSKSMGLGIYFFIVHVLKEHLNS